jgi:hypothetical protein
MEVALQFAMLSASRFSPDFDTESDTVDDAPVVARPLCYGITVFTMQFREVRDFYVNLLDAEIVREKAGTFCGLNLAGVPFCLRRAEHGEMVSYFHLHIELQNQDDVLARLRRRGIVVTTVGPFTNFRDPEGRVIKLSEDRVSIL